MNTTDIAPLTDLVILTHQVEGSVASTFVCKKCGHALQLCVCKKKKPQENESQGASASP
jgi:DTW domain-containing protein YfiP